MVFTPVPWDLSLWLAGIGIILIIASHLLSPPYGKGNLYIDNKRLRNAAFAVLTIFLATVVMRTISIVLF